MKRSIMAVGAHADDIEINVGGTLLKYRAAGYEVVYVMATNNMSGQASELLPDGTVRSVPEATVPMMARRKRECGDAAAALGTAPIHLDHPQRHYNGGADARTPQEVRYGCARPEGVPEDGPTILTACEHPPSVDRLANLILEKAPECILTHGVSQVNIEHFAVCLLVTNAFWKAVEGGFRGALLHWREHHVRHGEFNCRWETFVDCTPHLDAKMQLIGLHRCQMPRAHLPDAAQRRATQRRGAACGCGAAELFTWVRHPEFLPEQGPGYPPLTLELVRNTRA